MVVHRCGRFGESLDSIFWHAVAYDVEQDKMPRCAHEPVHFNTSAGNRKVSFDSE